MKSLTEQFNDEFDDDPYPLHAQYCDLDSDREYVKLDGFFTLKQLQRIIELKSETTT